MQETPGLSYHPPTFAGFPRGTLDDVGPGMVVAGGVLADSADTRPGAAGGPPAIRAAAARFVARIAGAANAATDHATGRTLRIPRGRWNAIDVGDIEADGADSVNVGYCAERMYKPVLEAGGIPLLLGGDSSIATVATAVMPEGFGVLHVTRSPAGAEDPDETAPEVIFGVAGQFPERWWEVVDRDRCLIVTAGNIATDGIAAAIRRTMEHLSGCRGVIVDVDMGVFDAGQSAGTPEIGIGGLAPRELTALAREVGALLPVRFVIVDGVAPSLDGRRRTEALAARVAIELIAPRVFS